MKTKFFTIAIALSSVVAMAQKKEIKNAEKAIEDGNYAEAKAQLSSVESLIPAEKEKLQADFYYTKGLAFIGKNNKNTQEVIAGVEALNKAVSLGNTEAQKVIDNFKSKLLTSAGDNVDSGKFNEAVDELYLAYNLDKTDTINLYYAANTAISANRMDDALTYHLELEKLGYVGDKVVYTAVSKETNEKESFQTKNQRDIYLRAGTHIKPGEQKEESKRPEIVKNIAVIYIQKGEKEKGMQALKKARQENPNDTSLMLSEAEVYYKAGELDKYRTTIEEVLKLEPDNAVLYYNLGVTTSKAGNNEQAEKFYKKAIELDPEMTNAYVNISSVILAKEKPLIEKMNSLGMSAADNKKYDELQKERKDLYRSAIPYLEKVLEKKEKGSETYETSAQTLMQIYSFLGEEEKAKALKQ